MCGVIYTCTYAYICLIMLQLAFNPDVSLPRCLWKWGKFSSVKNRNRSDGLDPFYTCVFQALTTHLFTGTARRRLHRAGAVRADTLERKLAEFVGRALPSCQLRIWLQDNSISELIVLKTRN